MEENEKVDDLNKTIELLNAELAREGITFDEKMKVTDRLLKAYSLRLKYAGTGRGGAFR